MSSLLCTAFIVCSIFASLLQCTVIKLPVEREPVVTVRNGSLTGIYSSAYHQDFFLGIPFAQPPVGNLRFRKPQSLENKWAKPRKADAYSASCVGYGPNNILYRSSSEDCLYLNVIRPSGYVNGKKQLPVGIWIHGGGYFAGSSIDQRFNLSYIVQQSVEIGKPFIAISMNYRVSAWGFLSSAEVIESGQANVGLWDQRLALHWVQENIAAFGGDPKQVTIWGESAGAQSVGNHLIAFGGRNDRLFRAAIMQSGSPTSFTSLSPSQDAFNNLTDSTGCSGALDKLQCLREIPFATLNQFFNNTQPGTRQPWAPVIDGDFIPGKASILLAQGKYVPVPIISGANSDEGTTFSPRGVNSTEDFLRFLTVVPIPTLIPIEFAYKILDAYPDFPSKGSPGSPPLPPDFRPGLPYGAQFRRAASYFGDAQWIAARRYTCQTWAKAGLDAYCYRFNTDVAGLPAELGATHFQEVAFVFHNTDGLGYAVNPFQDMSESYFDLATLMSSSWASFIHDLDPNSWRARGQWKNKRTPLWPKYNSRNPQDIVWDANFTGLAVVEKDNFRASSISLIISHFADIYDL